MSKIALSGDASGTGTFTIASPNSNSNRTLTLPDNTGTVLTSASTVAVGQLPAQLSINGSAPSASFAMDSAGRMTTPNQPLFKMTNTSSSGALTGGVWTKVALNNATFDRNSNCNTSTNRFVAPVAGIYSFSGVVRYNQDSNNISVGATFAVNGSVVVGAASLFYSNGVAGSRSAYSMTTTTYFSLNANDYVELYGIVDGTSGATFNDNCSLSGQLLG
jgi:hypothetical protein